MIQTIDQIAREAAPELARMRQEESSAPVPPSEPSKRALSNPVRTMTPDERQSVENLAIEIERDNLTMERLRLAREKQASLYRELVCSQAQRQLGLGRILHQVAIDMETTVPELVGPSRTANIVKKRWEFIRRGKEAGNSNSAIGRAINRDHGTVLHALQQLELQRKDLCSMGRGK